MEKQMNVERWVELFREIGLDDATMRRWHALFEERYPDAHREFLGWLGLPPGRIEEIRKG
ncbi:MAG: hypothetical protein A2X84_05080 [Desulfuromonadaceae bacterium GWC2_58_13]|nr:MAG: hypothetical protein A2X84_05080 [Desulfuromonadaceae bacterium GWC2_58_13]